MIARLRGTLLEKQADRVIVDSGGVGYEVFIPLSTFYELGDPGSEVTLHVHTHVREDALNLFGFLTPREKTMFFQLIQISGIGPKLAVTILSGLPIEQFVRAVADGNLARLSSIPGVGRKTAERIVLELREKIGKVMPDVVEEAGSPLTSIQNDVVSALVNLGYPRKVAEKGVAQAAQGADMESFEALLRGALKKISG